jgi:hypothetical protein
VWLRMRGWIEGWMHGGRMPWSVEGDVFDWRRYMQGVMGPAEYPMRRSVCV